MSFTWELVRMTTDGCSEADKLALPKSTMTIGRDKDQVLTSDKSP